MGEPVIEWVRRALAHRPSIVEIGPVFAVPHALPPWGGTDVIRYAAAATADDGQVVYLRSHGQPFNIVAKPWLGQSIDGCYSVGPGLVDGDQRTVVLAQAFGRDGGADVDRLATDGPWVQPTSVTVASVYGRRCYLLSAWV